MTISQLSGVEGLRVLLESVGVARIERDVIVADGPDSLKFLQSQLSQDVSALAEGASTWSFLLQPTGKLVGFFRLTRTAAEQFRLDGDPGMGAGVEAALRRFLIRTKCTITLTPSVPVRAVRGPGSTELKHAYQNAVACFPTMEGFDLFDDGSGEVELPGTVPDVAPECYEYLRVASGVPVWSSELTESTIPNATGLVPIAVSFTKGCYVGQELVERIDSRGAATPRSLRRIRFTAPAGPDAVRVLSPGAELSVDSGSKGTLSSVVGLSGVPDVVGLGYLARDVEVGATVTAGAGGGPTGEVSALGIG